MATTITADPAHHYFIWRYLYDSMHAAQKPKGISIHAWQKK